MAEVDLEKHLGSKAGEAPQFMVFLDDHVGGAITADTIHIFTQCNTVAQALHHLVILYYVCGLDYPKICSQVLGPVQHFVLKDNVNFSKNYSNKCTTFKFKLDEIILKMKK